MSGKLPPTNALKFPQSFLWGAATSSHQIEGNNLKNDWWAWEAKGRTTDLSGAACDSYHRFAEDFDIAQRMHHNAHRFSVEWSRIEPAQGVWDNEAIDHYKNVVKALKARGLEPVVTLHHFTNPAWTTPLGAWENPKMADWFQKYAEKMVIALGGDVKYWCTINEANVLVHKSYIEGDWPPGAKSLSRAHRAMSHLADAHKRTYRAIHALYNKYRWPRPWVGLAHHMLYCEPLNPSDGMNRLVSKLRMYFNNDYFLRKSGGKANLDFLGVNYYFREIIQKKPHFQWMSWVGEPASNAPQQQSSERNDLKWEIFPRGISRLMRKAYKDYRVPIMVTENGTCTHDESLRMRFIDDHLLEIKTCIDEGIPVLGYMHWSLLDNFEWSIGYLPRFGLVAVDPFNRNRTLKESGRHYAEICRNNALIRG
jgi:beta-glucosidase